MKVFVLILQKPLRVKTYTSLTALIDNNNISDLGASKSKLEKWNWSFDYITHNVVISKTEALTAGDVRRLNEALLKEYLGAFEHIRHQHNYVSQIVQYLNREIQIHEIGVVSEEVRNRTDAISYIKSWNAQIDDLIIMHKSLVSVYPNIPTIDFFKVFFQDKE